MILRSKKQNQPKSLGFSSLFENFADEMKTLIEPNMNDCNMVDERQESSKDEINENKGAFYFESSSYQSVNGQQTKLQVEKKIKKDGKLLMVNREEKLN